MTGTSPSPLHCHLQRLNGTWSDWIRQDVRAISTAGPATYRSRWRQSSLPPDGGAAPPVVSPIGVRPVGPVNLVQRMRRAEADAGFRGARPTPGPVLSLAACGRVIPGQPELHGHEGAVPVRSQRPARHALGMPEPVHVSGVEKGDPQIQGRTDSRFAVAVVHGSVVVAVDRRATVDQPRDQAGRCLPARRPSTSAPPSRDCGGRRSPAR